MIASTTKHPFRTSMNDFPLILKLLKFLKFNPTDVNVMWMNNKLNLN